jgi:putative SOS response-associated peptidase YedK
MAFAGLRKEWSDNTETRTLTINEIVGELHERMPVIIDPYDWPMWFGRGGSRSCDAAATGRR